MVRAEEIFSAVVRECLNVSGYRWAMRIASTHDIVANCFDCQNKEEKQMPFGTVGDVLKSKSREVSPVLNEVAIFKHLIKETGSRARSSS